MLATARPDLTCNRGAGVLQQAIDEAQALIALRDGALYVELIHYQGLPGSLCQAQHCLHLHGRAGQGIQAEGPVSTSHDNAEGSGDCSPTSLM